VLKPVQPGQSARLGGRNARQEHPGSARAVWSGFRNGPALPDGPRADVGGLIAQDTQRKRLAKHPQYVPLEASVDAGATEVDNDAVGLR
jgi:hypothetical protein